MLPLFFCAWVCLFAVVGGMLCKSDKPSIIIIIIIININYRLPVYDL